MIRQNFLQPNMMVTQINLTNQILQIRPNQKSFFIKNVPTQITHEHTNKKNHTNKTTTLSIHSSIFPATQNTNAKSITQNFRPVQIDTIEKQCPENSNLKNGLPLCLPHFFNPKKSEEIFYHNQKSMTKNLDKKIRPQKNHQKFFRHFFSSRK